MDFDASNARWQCCCCHIVTGCWAMCTVEVLLCVIGVCVVSVLMSTAVLQSWICIVLLVLCVLKLVAVGCVWYSVHKRQPVFLYVHVATDGLWILAIICLAFVPLLSAAEQSRYDEDQRWPSHGSTAATHAGGTSEANASHAGAISTKGLVTTLCFLLGLFAMHMYLIYVVAKVFRYLTCERKVLNRRLMSIRGQEKRVRKELAREAAMQATRCAVPLAGADQHMAEVDRKQQVEQWRRRQQLHVRYDY